MKLDAGSLAHQAHERKDNSHIGTVTVIKKTYESQASKQNNHTRTSSHDTTSKKTCDRTWEEFTHEIKCEEKRQLSV